jgi:prevent-host-death family protein
MTWAVAEAKAKFSEVLDKVETSGPQIVTRRKREYIVLTREQYEKREAEEESKPFVSAWDALAPSSGAKFDVEFERTRSKARAVKF